MKRFLILLCLMSFIPLNSYAIEKKSTELINLTVKKDKKADDLLKKQYSKVSKDPQIYESLEYLKGTIGDFSRVAILGRNLTQKPIKIQFKDLGEINQQYRDFDALGWMQGSKLFIYVNNKHADAPKPALAALLAHEALHQDKWNSLNEETYAWTLEAATWLELSEKYPKECNVNHPLVARENLLKKLFIKGNYTDKMIRKAVYANPGYKNLPESSPGFNSDL